jgi:hypothetical protein
VAALCGEGDLLRGERLRQFRDMVANAPLSLPTRQELQADHLPVDEGKNSLEAWHQHFAQGREQLVAFLDQAISLNAPIRCWL